MARTKNAKGKPKYIRVKLKDISDKFNNETEIDIANYYLPIFVNCAKKIETTELDKIKEKSKREKIEEESVEFRVIK